MTFEQLLLGVIVLQAIINIYGSARSYERGKRHAYARVESHLDGYHDGITDIVDGYREGKP